MIVSFLMMVVVAPGAVTVLAGSRTNFVLPVFTTVTVDSGVVWADAGAEATSWPAKNPPPASSMTATAPGTRYAALSSFMTPALAFSFTLSQPYTNRLQVAGRRFQTVVFT